MSDCQYRKAGEEFCADCPLRAVRSQCLREGYCNRTQTAIPPSWHTRIGVFLLSALSIMLTPVAYRGIYKVAAEGMIPDPAVWIVAGAAVIAGVVVVPAAFYGLYSSCFTARRA
jgi:hypothetical protein